MNRHSQLLHLTSLFVLMVSLLTAAPVMGDKWKDLDQYVVGSMQRWQVPGLALAVVEDGRLVFSKGFGRRDILVDEPVTPTTMFAIGSASKAFTSTALGMLVDQGKISWDKPVEDYLPGFRVKDPWVSRNINLRDMLSHRTGLKGADILWVWKEGYLSREQLVESIRYEAQAFPFRSQWHYNNLMVLAAGQVVPAVTGLSWDDYIKENIFRPLGMNASNTSVRALTGIEDVACPHLLQSGKVVGIAYRNIDRIAPAGSINSNITDMVQWLNFQLAEGHWKGQILLQPRTVLTIRSPQITMPIPYPVDAVPGAHFLGYGLCWFLHDYHGVKVVEHGGNIDGMTAMVAMVPERKSGLVVLCNLGTTRIREVLMYKIFDIILGLPETDWNPHFLRLEESSQKAVAKANEEKRCARINGTKPSLPLSSYAGRYHNDQMGELYITAASDRLFLSYQGRTVDLSHWHYETFLLPEWNIEDPAIDLLTFEVGSSGVVESLHEESLGTFSKVK